MHPPPAGRGERAVTPGAQFVSRAVFDGTIVCASRSRTEVERALPRELRLTPRGGEADSHPVLFVVGDQTRGASRVAGIEVEWGTRYEELVVAVPFVAPRRGGSDSVFAAGMFSSYYVPNWWGRFAFGYGKQLASLERRGPIQALTTPEHGLVFQLAVEAAGPWQPADETPIDDITGLCRMAALPWLGRKPGGGFVRSFSRWIFEDAEARRVDARPLVHRPVMNGLPTGAYEPVRGASVEVRGMTWWLSWPRSCVL